MSKGKWKKGKVQPRIKVFCAIRLTARGIQKCSKCGKPIEQGKYYVYLAPPFKKDAVTGLRHWNLHLDCFLPWIEGQLRTQAEDILRLRGYNPFDMPFVYAPSQGIKLGTPPKDYTPTLIDQIPR